MTGISTAIKIDLYNFEFRHKNIRATFYFFYIKKKKKLNKTFSSFIYNQSFFRM